MGTRHLDKLHIPEGKPAWLNYDQYQRLKILFEATSPTDFAKLYHFLRKVAKVDLPADYEIIHFNAFVLLRRGYQVEEITPQEYADLVAILAETSPADPDDLALYEAGQHRALYNYLTKKMGLSVIAGRGPVWERAKALIQASPAHNLREKQDA